MKTVTRFVMFALPLLLLSCGGPVESTGDAANNYPTVSVSASSTSEQPGNSIAFTVVATDYQSVECDFDGDGTADIDVTSTYSPFSHTYGTTGTYSASCTAINSEGFSTTSNYITIDITYISGYTVDTLNFPIGVLYVSDVHYDKQSNTVAVLGFSSDVSVDPAIYTIDYDTGDMLDSIQILSPPAYLNQSSELVRVENSYYATSYGLQDTIPQAYIYKIYSDGTWEQDFACPAAETDGYCEGLTWDGTYLWSGASDSKNLTQFTISGVIVESLAVAWQNTGIFDLTYDSANDRFIVMRDNTGRTICKIDRGTGDILSEAFISSMQNGDYDGSYWLSVDNGSQIIDKRYIGE